MNVNNGCCWLEKKKVPNGHWQSPTNRKQYLQWLGGELAYQKPEDWYRIRCHDFQDNYGGGLLTQIYKGSPQRSVRELYPDIRWKPWLFTHVPNGWWKKRQNRREFIVDLQQELSIMNLDDWYDFSKQEYLNHGGGRLFNYLEGRIAILREVYPHHSWHEWLFVGGVVPGFFDNILNRLSALKWLERKLGWKRPADWRSISANKFRSNKLGGLLTGYYNNSPIAAAIELHPELKTQIHDFSNVPRKYWLDLKNRRKALLAMEKKLGVRKLDDWYDITQSAIRKAGYQSLHHHYGDSTYRMLQTLRPRRQWLAWKFCSCPNHYWDSKRNRIDALGHLEQKMKWDNPENWYSVTAADFKKNDLDGLLMTRYDHSPANAARELHPEYGFLPWRFRGTPKNFWKARKNRKAYIEWLGRDVLNFTELKDWYEISLIDFINNFGWGMLHGYYRGRYIAAIVDLLPKYDWDISEFCIKFRKQQNRIFKMTKKLYPSLQVEYEYSGHGVRYSDTNYLCFFDIFIPDLCLAIEFHGETHYEPLRFIGHTKNDVKKRRKKDREKRELCIENGIALVEIDYKKWYRALAKKRELAFLERSIAQALQK